MSGALRIVFWNGLGRDSEILTSSNKESDIILLAEPSEEATYVRHHKKKLAFQLSALRHLKRDLEGQGYRVEHDPIDDPETAETWFDCIQNAVKRFSPDRIVFSEPPDWRLHTMIENLRASTDLTVEVLEDENFFCTRQDFADWAKHRSGRMLMEAFYRDMRRQSGFLIDQRGEPEGGRWNYDMANRESWDESRTPPERPSFPPDSVTEDVIGVVKRRFGNHFGDVEPFNWAVTPHDAERALDHFIEFCLPDFGTYQDAMATGQDLLYHSVLSPYINHGLLKPYDVCAKAEQAYRNGHAPLNAVEGFIRQILGWREYVRGIYWLKMPDYAKTNFFAHERALPEFYWTGKTDMHCVSEAVRNTKEHAYAHHIQRLMITGNFALLAGIAPKAIEEWYLIVYADAFEWVELPNVHGMSQYADGGYLATKPYVSGGNYINKMSNYCKSCTYNIKHKTGETACPFNYLYWNFLMEHDDKLRRVGRMNPIFRTLDKMGDDRKAAIRASAAEFLDNLTLDVAEAAE